MDTKYESILRMDTKIISFRIVKRFQLWAYNGYIMTFLFVFTSIACCLNLAWTFNNSVYKAFPTRLAS